MTEPTLTRILRLSQQLSYQYKNASDLLSKSWLELELARGTLGSIELFYNEWLKEKDLEQEQLSE